MNATLSARERAGIWITRAAKFSIAALLFSSPWMVQWLGVLRRTPPVFSGYTDFFIYPSDLFIVLSVLFGLSAPFVAGKPFQRGPWYLTLPLAALVLLSFASVLVSVDPALTFYHSMRFLFLFGVYLALVNTPLRAEWIVLPLALAVMIQSSVAALQFLNQGSVGLSAWGELHLDPAATGVSILRYDDARILRAYGLTDHPNLLGGFLAFALIFVLGYYLDPAHRRARYGLLVPLAFGVIALFFSFSRAAELALGIGVVVMLAALLREQTQRFFYLRAFGLGAVVVAVALVVPFLNNQRLIALRVGQENAFQENVSEARSLVERDVLIASANRIFYQRQLLGVGNGALPLGMYFLDKDFPRDQYDYQPAHLVVLVAAAELGLLGAFLWMWLMLAPLVVMWRQRAQMSTQPWLAAVGAALIVMLVVGFFDYYPWLWQSGRIWQWSAWGLFAAAFSARRNANAAGKVSPLETLTK